MPIGTMFRALLPHTGKRLSLQTYLVGVILLSSVPIALVLSYEVFGAVRAQQRLIDDSSQRSAQAAAQSVGRGLSRAADALASVARRIRTDDPEGIAAELHRLLDQRKNWLGVFAFDAAGKLVVDSTRRMEAAEPARAALFEQGRGARDAPFIASALSPLAGRPAIAVMVAVPQAQGAGGLLGAWIDAAAWQTVIDSSALPPGGFLALVDQQGVTIARSPAPAGDRAEPASRAPRASFMQRVAGAPWSIAAGSTPEDAASGATRAFIVAIGTTGGCMLLGLWLGMLLARRVTRPLGQLSSGAAELARLSSPIVEVDLLRERLIAAHTREAQAREQLRVKVVDFQALFESCPIGLAYAHDGAGNVVTYNPAMQALLGPAEAAASVGVRCNGVPLPIDEQPVQRAARRGASVGPLELQIERADGRAFVILAQAVPLLDPQGQTRGAIGAAVDITQRKDDEARLQGTNRAMDEFLAMLGHELRNPLGAISAAVEVLHRAETDSPLAARSLGVLGRQAANLARITDELLDAARVINGTIHLVRQPIDLGAAADRALAALRLTAVAQHHPLVSRIDGVWIVADAMRIEQIVTNLLTNAFRHTPPGGAVELSVQREGADAVLRVRDHGPGIPPELVERVFDLFVQGEQPLDRQRGGLGVGLTLVRRLAVLHGGSASATSSSGGSLFEVRLPAAAAPAALSAAPAAAAATVGRAARSILIVEQPPEAEALAARLRDAGYRVECASDPAAAPERLAAARPDAAIVGLGVEAIDAIAIVQAARAAGYPGLMVAAGDAALADPKQLRRAGFDASLARPIDPAHLRELIAAFA
jgi:PAS domain S-box-containing protein